MTSPRRKSVYNMIAEPFPQLWLLGQGRLSVCLQGSGHGGVWVNVDQFHQQGTDGAPLVSWHPCERLAPHIRKSVPQSGVSISSKAMGTLLCVTILCVFNFFYPGWWESCLGRKADMTP